MALGLGGQTASIETIWRGYLAAEAQGTLQVRTTCYMRISRADTHISVEKPPPFLTLSGVKLFADGSIQGHTARLTDPYADRQKEHGMLLYDQSKLASAIRRYHEQGLQVAVHANGDQAVHTVTAAYRDALGPHGTPAQRHRIEHAQTARLEDVQGMADLGLLPNFFIGHVYYWGDRHRDQFLGPQGAASLNLLGTAAQLGLIFALHSDAPVTPINPLLSIATAVNRETLSGAPLGVADRIPIARAWQAYTTTAAYLGFREHLVGDIRPVL